MTQVKFIEIKTLTPTHFPIRRSTIADTLPSEGMFRQISRRKLILNKSTDRPLLNPLSERKSNQSTPIRQNSSRHVQRSVPDYANISLPNLKQIPSRLRRSISNPLASQVLEAVQSCSTLDLPWSKVDKPYLPQLVWPEDLFDDDEREEIEEEAALKRIEFEIKFRKGF